MKKTTIYVLTLYFLIVAGISANAESTNFSDVPQSHWAYNSIMQGEADGVVEGYPDGTFKPSNPVTRAEFIAMVTRVTELQENRSTTSFADVASHHWAYDAVQKGVELGFINPADFGGAFEPDKAITRYEIAKWLADGLAQSDPGFQSALEDTRNTVLPFTEYYNAGFPEEQVPYIAVTRGTGVLTGYPDGSFGADKTTTRAEVVTVLDRYTAIEGTKAESYSDLNELREVGTTGTNVVTLANATWGRDFQRNEARFTNIVGKPITAKNNSGVVKVHRYIVVEAIQNSEGETETKGVYGDMFFDKSIYSDYFDHYLAYIEISFTPSNNISNPLTFMNGVDNVTVTRLFFENPDKYNVPTYPNSDVDQFFVKDVERRFWVNGIYKRGFTFTVTADDHSVTTFNLD